MNEQQNTNLVKQGYTAFSRGDIPGVLAVFAENAEWRCPKVEGAHFGGDYHGRKEIAKFFEQLNEAEEVLRFEPRQFVAQGNTVVAIGIYEASVRSTGRKYGTEWVHVFEVANGKITRFQEYADVQAAVQAHQKAVTV
jgi:uncharacterized protein